ncbi:MAG: hypothetical protein HDR82_07705 [Bacteroides sp.]|nr:hypothetical protein [Bacteroides sp.]
MKYLLFVIQVIVLRISLTASDFRLPLQGLNYDLEKYNKIDKTGQKTGIWIYECPDTIIISYYTNGKKNGVERRFIKSNDSYYLGYQKLYIDGILIMPSIAYYDNGVVKHEIIEQSETYSIQPTVSDNDNQISYKCYIKNYSHTGQFESEGWVLVPSDDMNDYYIDGPHINIQLSDLIADTKNTNQLDNKGNKTGVWIIERSDIVEVAYYKDGLKNGLWRQFMKKNGEYRLNYEAYYLNGYSYGFKIAYDEDGNVAWIETNMSENTNFIDNQAKFFKGYHPDFISKQAFYNYYYPNGTLKAYGWTLKADDDSEQIDEDFVGDWYFFTETGDSIILNEDQIRAQGLPFNLF